MGTVPRRFSSAKTVTFCFLSSTLEGFDNWSSPSRWRVLPHDTTRRSGGAQQRARR
jgi:hypothetical protein